jgi:UDP-N-acetylmuramate--alanine ligase
VGRRLEARGQVQGALWVDDYAHHPTEIAAAVAAIRATHGKRIVAVFQPHRYTRTMALLGRFAECFAGVAELVLLPIYPAGEAPIPGVTAEGLAERVTKRGGTRVHVVADHPAAASAALALLGENDVFLTIGAGDVYRVGELARAKEHVA